MIASEVPSIITRLFDLNIIFFFLNEIQNCIEQKYNIESISDYTYSEII